MQQKNITQLLNELEDWSNVYEFSFQFWGPGNNNVFINKSNIELAWFGGEDTIPDILKRTLDWINKQNPKGYMQAKQNVTHCQSCGAQIAHGNDFCGECMCEDDCCY